MTLDTREQVSICSNDFKHERVRLKSAAMTLHTREYGSVLNNDLGHRK